VRAAPPGSDPSRDSRRSRSTTTHNPASKPARAPVPKAPRCAPSSPGLELHAALGANSRVVGGHLRVHRTGEHHRAGLAVVVVVLLLLRRSRSVRLETAPS